MGKTAYLVSPNAAAKQLGCRPQTIRAGCEAGTIECVWVDGPRGRQPRLTRATVEALKQVHCSYVGCEAAAPGPSGRCGEHAAGVKYAPQRRQCAHCGEDMGLVYGSVLEQGRGSYCSRECNGKAAHERDPERLPQLNRAGARGHHRLVEAEIDELLRQDTDLARAEDAADEMHVAPRTLLLVHYFGGNLPGHVFRVRGSDRLLFRRSEITAYKRSWVAMGDGRRRSWLDPEQAVARLEARGLVELYATQRGLSHREAAALIKLRVADRRSDLGRRQSPGAPRKDALRARLLEHAEVFIDQTEREGLIPHKTAILRSAVELDWDDHPNDWPRSDYPEGRAGDLGMDPKRALPQAVKRANELVGAEVKALQKDTGKTLAA